MTAIILEGRQIKEAARQPEVLCGCKKRKKIAWSYSQNRYVCSECNLPLN